MFNFELSESLSPLYIHLTTFISLILNGATNIPSSQIVYLTLGYLVNVSKFNPYLAVLLGAIGNTIGNLILYRIVMNNSDFLNSKLAKFLNVERETLEKYTSYFAKRGWGWLILGKMTPSIKVLVPIIVGLSKISMVRAAVIFFVGSLLWAILVTYLGYYFGKQASLFQFYLIVTGIYVLIAVLSYIRSRFYKKI